MSGVASPRCQVPGVSETTPAPGTSGGLKYLLLTSCRIAAADTVSVDGIQSSDLRKRVTGRPRGSRCVIDRRGGSRTFC